MYFNLGKNATAPIVRVQDMDLDAQIDDSPPVHVSKF